MRGSITRRSIAAAGVMLVSLALGGCTWSEFGIGTGDFTRTGYFPMSGTVFGTPILAGSYFGSGYLSVTAVCPNGSTGQDWTMSLGDGLGNYVTQDLCGTWSGQGANPEGPFYPTAFSGQYTITSGSGIYAGATGTGTITAAFYCCNDIWTVSESGTITLPGTASSTASVASDTTRRTFRTRGVVSVSMLLCNGAARHLPLSSLSVFGVALRSRGCAARARGVSRRFSGTGSRRLGDITVRRASTVRWTLQTAPAQLSFKLAGDRQRIVTTVRLRRGQLAVPPNTYHDARIVTRGHWSIQIR